MVKDSGAAEAITQGPHGFLQVMAFCWFLASVGVLWVPPDWVMTHVPAASVLFGPSALSLLFMVCSLIHVVLLVTIKFKRPIDGVDAVNGDEEATVERGNDGTNDDLWPLDRSGTTETPTPTKT